MEDEQRCWFHGPADKDRGPGIIDVFRVSQGFADGGRRGPIDDQPHGPFGRMFQHQHNAAIKIRVAQMIGCRQKATLE